MTSAERTIALSGLARQIALELRKLDETSSWALEKPTEDVYSVYLHNFGKARIYIDFDGYNEPKRLNVGGYLHIGKNGSYVDVYERSSQGTWNKAFAPSITVAIARGPQAIAKDIAKRFLPEYLRVFALAEAKVQADAEYDAQITVNLQRLGKVAGVTVAATSRGSEVNKHFSFHTGNQSYHEVAVNADSADLKLDSLTFEQAENIIRYLKGGVDTSGNSRMRALLAHYVAASQPRAKRPPKTYGRRLGA